MSITKRQPAYHPFMHLKHMHFLFTVTFVFALVVTVLSSGGEAWAEKIPGKPVCGGVENGKLQEACGRMPAKYISKARGECPRGSFFDLGTWTCYQCPSGYQRTANSVTEWDACSKDVPDQRVRAQYKGRTSCPPGAFIDPRKGGECWSCPSGYGRTAAPVDAWDACGAVFKDARSATFRGKACKTGFFDPRKGGECWTCPPGTLRTAAAVDAWDACIREVDLKPAKKIAPLTCEAGDHFDLVDGGTCWRCPEDYVRTIFNVKGREACETSVVKWDMPDRNLPGLFGLRGAEEIAIEILKEREALTGLMKESAAKLGKNPEQWAATEWKLIADDPAKSSYLSTLILMKAVEASGKPAPQRTQAENQLIQEIEKGIRENRIFYADQAKQIYDNWVRKRELEMGKQKGRMTTLTAWKGVPPDVNEIVTRGLNKSGPAVAQTALGIYAFTAIKGSTSFVKLVSPHAAGAAREAAELAANMINAGKQVPAHIAKAANSATMGMASAGPAIIVTASMIVAQVTIEDLMEAERIRITTDDNVRKAQQPVNLSILLQQQDGMGKLISHWGIITSKPTRPGTMFYAALNGQNVTPQNIASQKTVQIKTQKITTSTVKVKNAPVNIPKNGSSVVISTPYFKLALANAQTLCLGSNDGKTLKLVGCSDRSAISWQWDNGRLKAPGNKCMDIAGARKNRGTQIILWQCHGNANQKWSYSGRGELVSGLAGQCSDVPGARLVAGNGLQTWDCNRTKAQLWKQLK